MSVEVGTCYKSTDSLGNGKVHACDDDYDVMR